MGQIKDILIEAEDARGVDHLEPGWYVMDGSFRIGAGPFESRIEASKYITPGERAEYINY